MALEIRREVRFLAWFVFFCAAGCSTQQPLISHAHVGHALTTWHDTPDRRGLMDVAASDLDVAEREARAACTNPGSHAGARHAANVVHALVPEAEPSGPGSGYGAVRAVMGTVEHLEFAATSADASLNLVTAIAELSVQGESVHDRLQVATDLAQDMRQATSAEFVEHCRQLLNELRVAIHGGRIGTAQTTEASRFATIGFRELHLQLKAALDRERDPSYTPVPRRYLLGLVRLPTGEWRYRLPRSGQHAHASVPFGYGY